MQTVIKVYTINKKKHKNRNTNGKGTEIRPVLNWTFCFTQTTILWSSLMHFPNTQYIFVLTDCSLSYSLLIVKLTTKVKYEYINYDITMLRCKN